MQRRKKYSRYQYPKECKRCEYFQPRWRYRFCYYTRCPYQIRDSTIRKTPLKKENFPAERGGELEKCMRNFSELKNPNSMLFTGFPNFCSPMNGIAACQRNQNCCMAYFWIGWVFLGKTGWIDKDGRVYIIYTVEDIMEALGCGNKKAIQLLAELEKKEISSGGRSRDWGNRT